MSEFLISTTEVVEILKLIFEFLVLVLAALYLRQEIMDDSYYNKIEKCKKDKEKARKDFDDVFEYNKYLLTEDVNASKIIEEERSKLQHEFEICDKKIDDYNKKSLKSKEISKLIMASVIGMLIVLFLLLCSVRSLVGGKIDYIVPVENNVNQDIAITAYYEVNYDGVGQKTLTIFVRNDSQKILENAILKEKSSGNISEVKTLEPGEEKIVSINVYSSKSNNYEFELSNIEFKE